MTILDPPVHDVLSRVVELGYLSLRKGTIVDWVPPRFNLWLSRLPTTLAYLSEYGRRHREFDGEFFLCLYDGWREYSQPIESEHRQYVPWAELDPASFLGIGNAREPRFRHRHPHATIYPELPRQVLTYNRHYGDRNALLLPDPEFLATGFKGYLRDVITCDRPWGEKIGKAVWRGSRNIDNIAHPREVAVELSKKSEYAAVLDASYERTPISWMLKYKYLLDIDGMVNAWSGFFWKLSSNSLVLKVSTHWEQWYYAQSTPNLHYLPLDKYEGLSELIPWCEANSSACQRIVTEAQNMVSKLTWDYAVTEYAIH